MSGKTFIAPGSTQAIVAQSKGLWAMNLARSTVWSAMTGSWPTEAKATAFAKGSYKVQTSIDMPIVRTTDFMAGAMDEVSFDLVQPPRQIPIMGSAMAEGRSVGFSFVDDRLRVNQARFPVNPGSRSSRKRTVWNTKALARAFAAGGVDRYTDQRLAVQTFGGRGSVDNIEWCIPLADSTEPGEVFSEIMVNPTRAGSHNRTFVCAQGGASLGKMVSNAGEITIATTDVMSIALANILSPLINSLVAAPRPIKAVGDKAAGDEPVHIALVPDMAYDYFATLDAYRQLQANALKRKSNAGSSPVFNKSDAYLSRVLFLKNGWPIYYKAGDDVPICASPLSQAETTLKVPAAFGTTHVLAPIIILGASAIVEGFGTYDDTDAPIFYDESPTDFKDKLEVMAGVLGGASKVQYLMDFGKGRKEFTDYGIITIFVAVPVPNFEAIS